MLRHGSVPLVWTNDAPRRGLEAYVGDGIEIWPAHRFASELGAAKLWP